MLDSSRFGWRLFCTLYSRGSCTLIHLKTSTLITLGALSGLCWYVGNGLSGQYWYLVWLAPIPTLIASFRADARTSYWLAFGSALLGRLSWFAYLQRVLSTLPALFIILLLGLAYAAIVQRTRSITVRLKSGYALLVYPAFMTAYEYLLIHLSSDGSATSLAYSQADVLLLIQVASLAGVLGITFVVSLFSSAVAVGWYAYRNRTMRHRYVVVGAFGLVGAAFLYGTFQIRQTPTASVVKVGLVTLTEPLHYVPDDSTVFVARQCAVQIRALAAQGARVVVLPETALRVNATTYGSVFDTLRMVARQHRLYLIVGCADVRKTVAYNAAFVLSPNGQTLAEHHKVHLIKGVETKYISGTQVTTFALHDVAPVNLTAGVAICKDLDFPAFIRQYKQQGVNVLLVPAWDFTVDDWLHARMALLRSVENGVPMVRVARRGRLTISDSFGRVLAETSAANGQSATLLGAFPISHVATFYTKSGDWLGVLSLLLATGFVLTGRERRPGTARVTSSAVRS